MFTNEVKNFGWIINKNFRNFFERFIIMLIQQLMVIFTIEILLRKCNNRTKFVKMRFETPSHPKHHIQHQVPTLVTKVYDTSTRLRRTGHVHRWSLLLLRVAVSLMRRVFSGGRWGSLSALGWKKAIRQLPQLLQFISYKFVYVSTLWTNLPGQLLMTKIGQSFSRIELPISRKLQPPCRDRVRPSTYRKFLYQIATLIRIWLFIWLRKGLPLNWKSRI